MSEYTADFYAAGAPNSRRSAELILPPVLEIVQPRSAVDVGCGAGQWTTVLQNHIDDVVAVDGDWVPENVRPRGFVAHDLEQPLSLGRSFDLVVCMEVAEHLGPEIAPRFVGDLTRLAPAVLFSAAIPFQGGTGHQNEQWQSYWAALFGVHAFGPLDVVRPITWTNQEVDVWYAQNCLLYKAGEQNRASLMLDLVHPRHYLAARHADRTRSGLRRRGGVRWR